MTLPVSKILDKELSIKTVFRYRHIYPRAIKAVAEGLSNKQIAEKLYISEGTVKNYITNILSKEDLSHRTALAVYYLTGKK